MKTLLTLATLRVSLVIPIILPPNPTIAAPPAQDIEEDYSLTPQAVQATAKNIIELIQEISDR